ncbi:MAG: O-antigen ligase family protein [Chloroflexi bacterium]|nr:O-antigen ligase family protein [Chloroflexota bacterium]
MAPIAVAWNQTKSAFIPEAIYQFFPLLSPETIHPNIMASLMILLLPLPLAYFWQDFTQRKRSWVLWVHNYRLDGNYSAVDQVAWRLFGNHYWGTIRFWLMRRRWLAVGLAGVTVVIAILLLTTFNTSTLVPESASGITDPSTMDFRLEVWRIALWMMSDFSFTGAGMGAFNDVGMRLYPFAENHNPGAHNVFLQVGVDLGIPGLIIYIAWLILALFMAWQTMKWAEKLADRELRTMMVGVFAGLIGYSAHGLIDSGLSWTLVSFMPWVVVAFIVAAHNIVRQTAVSLPTPQSSPTPHPDHPTPPPIE